MSRQHACTPQALRDTWTIDRACGQARCKGLCSAAHSTHRPGREQGAAAVRLVRGRDARGRAALRRRAQHLRRGRQRPAVVPRVRGHEGHALHAQRLPQTPAAVREGNSTINSITHRCKAERQPARADRARAGGCTRCSNIPETGMTHRGARHALMCSWWTSLRGAPSPHRHFMCGAVRAHPRVVNLLQQGVDVLLHGVAVPGSVGAAWQEWVDAPYWAAAEHEGHPRPAVVLRCRRRLHSQLASRRAVRPKKQRAHAQRQPAITQSQHIRPT